VTAQQCWAPAPHSPALPCLAIMGPTGLDSDPQTDTPLDLRHTSPSWIRPGVTGPDPDPHLLLGFLASRPWAWPATAHFPVGWGSGLKLAASSGSAPLPGWWWPERPCPVGSQPCDLLAPRASSPVGCATALGCPLCSPQGAASPCCTLI